VIYENLRPEKPPRPFVRGGQKGANLGDEGGVEGEGDGVDGTKKKRKTRKKNLKVATNTDETKDEIVPPTPSPKKTRKKRAVRKAGEETIDFEEDSGSKSMGQDDRVGVIDGAQVEQVEEDEHPEVVGATKEREKDHSGGKGKKVKRNSKKRDKVKK